MEDRALPAAVPAQECASCIRSINVGPVGAREALQMESRTAPQTSGSPLAP